MKMTFKRVIAVLSVCIMFLLGFSAKCLTSDFRARTKGINTDTVSITLGERHTCQVTDKISGSQWHFKTVLHRKGQEIPSELKHAGNENVSITGAGRYIIVDDKINGKRYKIKM